MVGREREKERERERLAGGRTLLAWLAGCSLALVAVGTCLAWFIHPACGLVRLVLWFFRG